MKVAYLGPPGTYSHEAALKQFPDEELVPVTSIDAVVETIQAGKADAGVLPVENSTNGAVNGAWDALLKGPQNFIVTDEVQVAVKHQLYTSQKLTEIERVYSHSQVWGQTTAWRSAELAHVECIDASSTSRAVELAMSDENGAAIAGVAAGIVHHVKPLIENISDQANNTTRFLVLRPQPPPKVGDTREKTGNTVLISLKVPHGKAGALMTALGSFASHDINLLFLCPRPSGVDWTYINFVEFDGTLASPQVQQALQSLSQVASVQIFGEYTRPDLKAT